MLRRPWGLSCVSATDTFPSSSGSQQIHTQQDVEHTLLWMFSHSVLSDSETRTAAHRLLCPQDFPARILEWVAMLSSRGSS